MQRLSWWFATWLATGLEVQFLGSLPARFFQQRFFFINLLINNDVLHGCWGNAISICGFHLWIVWMDGFWGKIGKITFDFHTILWKLLKFEFNISFSHQIVLFSAQIERSDNQHFCHLGTAFRHFDELFTNQTGKSELFA